MVLGYFRFHGISSELPAHSKVWHFSWTDLKVLCLSEWMLLSPFLWRKQKHPNATKILQWESNPNGRSPESCLTPGGRIVNLPAASLWNNIWSQECTSNLCFLHPSAVQLACLLPCVQGCQSTALLWSSRLRQGINPGMEAAGGGDCQSQGVWQSHSSLGSRSALFPEQAQPCLLT